MAYDIYQDNSDGGWAAANFLSGAVPVNTDEVLIPDTVTLPILGTDQSAVTLNDLRIAEGMQFDIGSSATWFQIESVKIQHEGTGCFYLQCNATDLVTINSPGGSNRVAHLKGQNIDAVHVLRGKVLLDGTLGTGGTLTGSVIVGGPFSQHKPDVTIDCALLASTGKLVIFSGACTCTKDGGGSPTVPIVDVSGGICTFSDGEVTRMDVRRGGLVRWNVGDSDNDEITAAYIYPGGVLDLTQNLLPKTIDKLYMWPESYLFRHEELTTINEEHPQGGGGTISGPQKGLASKLAVPVA